MRNNINDNNSDIQVIIIQSFKNIEFNVEKKKG